jgi:hypothetical protein
LLQAACTAAGVCTDAPGGKNKDETEYKEWEYDSKKSERMDSMDDPYVQEKKYSPRPERQPRQRKRLKRDRTTGSGAEQRPGCEKDASGKKHQQLLLPSKIRFNSWAAWLLDTI